MPKQKNFLRLPQKKKKKKSQLKEKNLLYLTEKVTSFPTFHQKKNKILITRKNNFPEQKIFKKQLRRLVLDQHR